MQPRGVVRFLFPTRRYGGSKERDQDDDGDHHGPDNQVPLSPVDEMGAGSRPGELCELCYWQLTRKH
jgi:hypothetical protein